MKTRQECIEAAGRVLAESRAICAGLSPREQAEMAWTPTSRFSVDELEVAIRAQRGMTPRAQAKSA